MHFAARVRTWRVARLYSEIAVSRKPFGIGHMYILLRMADTVTSRNIELSLWDTLYMATSPQITVMFVRTSNLGMISPCISVLLFNGKTVDCIVSALMKSRKGRARAFPTVMLIDYSVHASQSLNAFSMAEEYHMTVNC
jgi:hypothetical protein